MATVAFWTPGKLYQPGDVVQANEQGTVTQQDPTNAGFESGDSGWTKDSGWTIDQVDAFQGTWSGAFAGEVSAGLLFSTDVIGLQKAQKTSNGTSFVANNIAQAEHIAASASLAVAVNKDCGDGAAFYSSNGTTWNTASTIPWDLFAADITYVTHAASANLFFAVGGSSSYWTTTHGDTWTERTPPTGFGNGTWIWDNGTLTYAMTSGGRTYSTSDGINWTLINASTGVTPLHVIWDGTKAVAIEAAGGVYKVYTSTDFSTWTENTAGGTSLTAALSSNNTATIAFGASTYVVVQHNNTDGATTDETATSPDLTTWTARAARAGKHVRYSSTLSKFVTTVGGLSSSDGILNSSSDGITWAQATYQAGGGHAEFASADLATTPPLRVMVNDNAAAVVPGQTVRARALCLTSANGSLKVGIRWYDSGASTIKTDYDLTPVSGASTVWRESFVAAQAPSDAATCSVVIAAQGGGAVRVDNVVWEYYNQAAKSGLIFRATQAAAGFSGTVEPVWPTVVSNTVVDNAVTWTAVLANCIVWEAFPILQSGSIEPTFATELDGNTADNTILWITEDQRVKDTNCPNSKQVAIAASKIFAGDDDVVAFSATVNPLDWTTTDDAGFIPFGLNTYGSQPVTALGLYRANLVAWNNKAFQMWQVDEDPANMAILDAVPIGNPFYKSGQAVSNDLVWLTEGGVRSMGIAGASTNLQAGVFGKQIDPLILAEIAAIADNDDIISLYYPGQGQYWIIFEETAYVLTMNGGKSDMSWSRYTFPSAITDWTILNNDLYLRSGDKVWKVDADTLRDDEGGANVVFDGEIWWPYLDFGALGQTKQMIGFDTVADGEYAVVFGYNQNDDSQVTTSYTISDGDTLVGDIIPMPIAAPSFQMRLTFTGNTAWEWHASALYLQDWRRTS